MVRKRWHGVVCVACVCLTLFGALDATSAELSHDSVEAIWKPQRLMFAYRSEGRTYSCDILEHKIVMILRRLGARDGLEVRRVTCHDLARQARFAVLLESPIAATNENISDVTQYDSKDELIARVSNVELPSAADLERFPAVWESVSFRRDHKLYLEAGDCALVQQLRRQVLPKMSVKVTKDIGGMDCAQELAGIAAPRLVVLALVRTFDQ